MGKHRLCGEGEEEETGVREGEVEEGEGEGGGSVDATIGCFTSLTVP